MRKKTVSQRSIFDQAVDRLITILKPSEKLRKRVKPITPTKMLNHFTIDKIFYSK